MRRIETNEKENNRGRTDCHPSGSADDVGDDDDGGGGGGGGGGDRRRRPTSLCLRNSSTPASDCAAPVVYTKKN